MDETTLTLAGIREAFPGYHVDVSLFPAGGVIDLRGCEECGTKGWGVLRCIMEA